MSDGYQRLHVMLLQVVLEDREVIGTLYIHVIVVGSLQNKIVIWTDKMVSIPQRLFFYKICRFQTINNLNIISVRLILSLLKDCYNILC